MAYPAVSADVELIEPITGFAPTRAFVCRIVSASAVALRSVVTAAAG